jgi:hypothetical protein
VKLLTLFIMCWSCCFVGFVAGCFWAGLRRDDEPSPLDAPELDHDDTWLPRGNVESRREP